MKAEWLFITDLEHKGDNITHEIITEARRTFLMVFDREDVKQLAHALDDVTDFIHQAADSMFIYRVQQPTRPAKELAECYCRDNLGNAESHWSIDK